MRETTSKKTLGKEDSDRTVSDRLNGEGGEGEEREKEVYGYE